jgi:hypothetical protein
VHVAEHEIAAAVDDAADDVAVGVNADRFERVFATRGTPLTE